MFKKRRKKYETWFKPCGCRVSFFLFSFFKVIQTFRNGRASRDASRIVKRRNNNYSSVYLKVTTVLLEVRYNLGRYTDCVLVLCGYQDEGEWGLRGVSTCRRARIGVTQTAEWVSYTVSDSRDVSLLSVGGVNVNFDRFGALIFGIVSGPVKILSKEGSAVRNWDK